MNFIKKKIAIIAIFTILVFSLILIWSVIEVVKIYKLKTDSVEQEIVAKEIFSASGKILSVGKDFLIISSKDIPNDLKVFVSTEVELINLKPPADLKGGEMFVYEKTETSISDFEIGGEVFIQSKENMFGKKEIKEVESITLY